MSVSGFVSSIGPCRAQSSAQSRGTFGSGVQLLSQVLANSKGQTKTHERDAEDSNHKLVHLACERFNFARMTESPLSREIQRRMMQSKLPPLDVTWHANSRFLVRNCDPC